MSAIEVTQKACVAISSKQYDHIRINIANGDMVGHTGDFSATVHAIEIVDKCLQRLYTSCVKNGALLLITADHGNADEMYQLDKKTGTYKVKEGNRVPSTSHSRNPVPFILIDPSNRWTLKDQKGVSAGGIAQIGSSLLSLIQLPCPSHYLPTLVCTND